MQRKLTIFSLLSIFVLLVGANMAYAAQIEKGPYLIYPGNTSQMTVLWQTDVTQGCTLKWGTTSSMNDGQTNTSEYGTDHQHKHTIPSLANDTKYYYNVSCGTASEDGSFYTAPSASAQNVKFLAFGDTRTNPSQFNKIAGEMIKSYNADTAYRSFTLLSGDYIATGSSESGWSNEFFPRNQSNIRQMQSELPIMGTIGNHEGSSQVFKKYWPYPYVNSSRFYWTFEYGPVQVFCVDQYTGYNTGSTQYNWLENELKTSTKEFKFIVIHEPGWSAGGGHSNDTKVQQYLHPLAKQYGVDIIFAGDNHYYARAEHEGVHHVTTGGGGAPLYTPNSNAQYIVATKKDLNFCEIDITGKTMNFTARDSYGSVIDSFSVKHQGGPTDKVTADFSSTTSDLTANFTDKSSSTGAAVNSWNWDFGDNQSSTQQNPSHTYSKAGTYQVKLTASNGTLSDNITKSVTVKEGGGNNELVNGQGVGISGAKGEWKHYFINVPSGSSNLVMKVAGGTGDVDLYTKFGSQPSANSWDCRPYEPGNTEKCTVVSPQTGKYYVSAYMYEASSNATMTASYDSSGPTKYDLVTNVSGQGSITLNPAGGKYDPGTQVKLTATPASGYTFSGWSGDLSGSTNPATITMNSNKNVTATFTGGPVNQKSCEGRCGDTSPDGSCWCDSSCASYNDCCSDKVQFCGF